MPPVLAPLVLRPVPVGAVEGPVVLVLPVLVPLAAPELCLLPAPVALAVAVRPVAMPAVEALLGAGGLAPVVVPGPISPLGPVGAVVVRRGSRVAVRLGGPACVVGAAG